MVVIVVEVVAVVAFVDDTAEDLEILRTHVAGRYCTSFNAGVLLHAFRKPFLK